ncbi:MAG: hypothetical protein Kow009_07260 [Spirochaetales bacterium]
MVYAGLFLLAILLVYLVLSLLGESGRWYRGNHRVKEKSLKGRPSERTRTCPLCGHVLVKGQRVRSIVFQGGTEAGGVKEQVSHLLGCHYCYPANGENPRRCPVCHSILPADGYLIARYFTRKGKQRRHVHVLGCTECRNRRHNPRS